MALYTPVDSARQSSLQMLDTMWLPATEMLAQQNPSSPWSAQNATSSQAWGRLKRVTMKNEGNRKMRPKMAPAWTFLLPIRLAHRPACE
jgi:hypothetical protein